MFGLARTRGILQATIGVAFLATLLALVPAALFDLGPDGEARFSFFPVVLTLLDPFTRTCLGHSLAVAVVAALGARIFGVPLGRLLSRSRLAGRRLGRILFLAPIVMPPAFLALGLEGWPEWEGGLERGFQAVGSRTSQFRFFEWTWPEARGWLGWTLIGVVQGIGVVVYQLQNALDRFDRAWYDTARLAGLSDRAIWKGLVWPFVRPNVARGVKFIFTLNLVECGIPLVFDLRRSIGFQVVNLAGGSDPFPRLASLTLLTLACIAAGALFTRLWVGGRRIRGTALRGVEGSSPSWTLQRSWPTEIAVTTVLVAWWLVTWLPIAGLARLALRDETVHGTVFAAGANLASRVGSELREPGTIRLLTNSLIVGLAGAVALLILDGLKPSRPGRGSKALASLLGRLRLMPPLLLGVAALALPRFLELAARGLQGVSPSSGLAGCLSRLAAMMDPAGFPLCLLLYAVCLDFARLTWPRVVLTRGERVLNRDRADAARLAGVRVPGGARRAEAGLGRIRWVVRGGLVAVVAATSLSPAILLSPTAEGRTITPGIVRLIAGSPGHRAQAATLAFLLGVVLLIVWIVAVLLLDHPRRGRFRGICRGCDLDERRM